FLCSSRRRHTRSTRDWSSDVCSSDLAPGADVMDVVIPDHVRLARGIDARVSGGIDSVGRHVSDLKSDYAYITGADGKPPHDSCEIGRASCREREENNVLVAA